MMCFNQCDYPSDDGSPCRCKQDAINASDRLLMHSEYRVVTRSIDAGHGWSCPDEYEVRNDAHLAGQLGDRLQAECLAARLNGIRAEKLKGKEAGPCSPK